MTNLDSKSSLPKLKDAEITIIDLMTEMRCTAKLTEAEMQHIAECSQLKTFKKGTFPLREGQIASTCYHIFKGCVREFYLMNGEARTTGFYMEGDSLSAVASKTHRKPAKQYWECVEETTTSLLTAEKE